MKIRGLSRRPPNWTVSNIICIFKGHYPLYICKTGWDIAEGFCKRFNIASYTNELELRKFNLIFQWRDKFANFLAVALEFDVLLRHSKIYWTSLPQTREKCWAGIKSMTGKSTPTINIELCNGLFMFVYSISFSITGPSVEWNIILSSGSAFRAFRLISHYHYFIIF